MRFTRKEFVFFLFFALLLINPLDLRWQRRARGEEPHVVTIVCLWSGLLISFAASVSVICHMIRQNRRKKRGQNNIEK